MYKIGSWTRRESLIVNFGPAVIEAYKVQFVPYHILVIREAETRVRSINFSGQIPKDGHHHINEERETSTTLRYAVW